MSEMKKCYKESRRTGISYKQYKEGGKVNWIRHILCRYSLLTHVQGEREGRIEVMGRRGRRCMQLLDDLRERIGHCKLTEEALDRTLWRACFGRGYGPL